MPVDYAKVKKIFLEVLEQPAGQPRLAFIDEACGTDIDLRNFVLGMLDVHEQHATPIPLGPTVLEQDVKGSPATPLPAFTPGDILAGKYKIIELIAEGGMGSVYRASRVTDMKMEVAIKVIKPGMDSQQVLSRFNIERQALALMKHENIARVLDAGMTENHLPFFVMELVKGLNLTKFCDESKLSIEERLSLFEQICSAVQHAHQKGIVHRDLKPNNILVALYDDKPVPKVIDFGLAKALHQPLTDDDLKTRFGAFVGTWQYTAPEQAKLNNLDIDTRADIYSLGVILYELLTGTTPLEKRRLINAAYDEVLRIIREEEPQKPSTKIHSSDELPSIAALRRSEPVKLERQIRGELDWIVMKALEKDRNRRYATANEFARDVNAYLHGEAVSAVPPSYAYRFSRFYKKHRSKLLVAAAMLLLLVAGLVTSTIGFIKASHSEQRAVQELATVKSLLAFIEDDMFAGLDPEERIRLGLPIDNNISVKQLLDNSANKFDKETLKGQPLIEARIRNTIGKAYYAIGMFRESEKHMRAAVQIGENLGPEGIEEQHAILENLGNVLLALENATEARQCFTKAGQYFQQSHGRSSKKSLLMEIKIGMMDKSAAKSPEQLQNVEKVFEQVAGQAKASGHFDLAVKAMMNQAETRQKLGKNEESIKLYEEALRVANERLGPDHPYTLAVMNNYAAGLQSSGAKEQAKATYLALNERAARVFSPNHPLIGLYKNNLASWYFSAGKFDEAEKLFVEALGLFNKVSPTHRITIVIKSNIASLRLTAKDYATAAQSYREIKPHFIEKYTQKNDRTLRIYRDFSISLVGLGRYDDALMELKELASILVDMKSPPANRWLIEAIRKIRSISEQNKMTQQYQLLLKRLIENVRQMPQPHDLLLSQLQEMELKQK